MHVTLKYFAVLRELLGTGEETLQLEEGTTVGNLQSLLEERHPSLQGRMDRVALAVNQQYASEQTILHEGDEIALFPPVGGGNLTSPAQTCAWSEDQRFGITSAPLEPERVRALVAHAAGGAIVDFLGRVRDHNQGKTVTHLEYEAYPAMVVKEFERLSAEVATRWPKAVLAIHHRMGPLAIGDLAVVISVSTPHRAEAFEACAYTIERLKETAPIWKREVYDDQSEWLGWGP